MNSSIDRDLHDALKRVEPSQGFTERVMAALPDSRRRSWYWPAAVAAGLAILSLLGGIEQRRHEHRMRVEQEQRRVLFALSLASDKLDHAMGRANLRLRRSAPDITIGVSERGRL